MAKQKLLEDRISLFEKRIQVLVGANLKEKLPQETLDSIVHLIKEDFSKKNYAEAYEKAIALLQEKVLEAFPEKVSDMTAGELKNDVLWIKN